ncbi:uncharacterized protein LOC110843518 isoform X1 [Folsomia candida]|uniref:uncharacterized protein LOC110843518 isoform X1 n=2 Tax=Folsomia candida TaxID=158441 RepID=UPI001604D77D|nr:uncharacterized protein LOC110843518 isoform X1 [Folsomia candida]
MQTSCKQKSQAFDENANQLDTEFISDIKSRMILHWNYRNLKDIPNSLLEHGTHIKEIYLKRNSLTSLPTDIGKLVNLTNLYLIGNQITEISEIGKLCNSLKVVDLSQNLLQFIPSSVASLSKLEQLVLTQNRLTCLPNELGRLKSLKFLELSGNMISHLPSQMFQGLEALEEFGIDGNPILHLPRCITTLHNLRYVSACKCNLLYLPTKPFYYLLHGKQTDGNVIPRNEALHGSREQQRSPFSSDFRFLFDSNPNLNYIPYWMIQLLGSDLDSHWCGFLVKNNLPADPILQQEEDRLGTNNNTLSLNPKFNITSHHGIKLVLRHWKELTLCFDEDVLQIHTATADQPPTMLEQCLRVVHTENLQTRTMSSHQFSRRQTQIVQPRLKYSSCVKDMSSSSSASQSLYDPSSSPHSSAIEIDGSISNLDQNISSSHPPPILPLNLKSILEQSAVAHCFSCMKPIFTETWLVVVGVPRGHRHGPQNNNDHHPVLPDANDLQISCIFFCSKTCHDMTSLLSASNWNAIIKHELKFKRISK